MDSTDQPDQLDPKKFKVLTKQFGPNERTLFATQISKYNGRSKCKERNFVVTNEYIYDLKKSMIKQKTSIQNIESLTISNISYQFVIHTVDMQKNCCYSHSTERDKIINIIKQLREAQQEGTAIHVSYLDVISLVPLIEKDKKDNYDRDDNGNIITPFRTIYSKEKGEQVTLEDFELVKQLRQGYFGRVLQIKKKDTGRNFAVKYYKKSDFELKKFEETDIERLRHPFLMDLEYCFVSKEKIYFGMPWMKSDSLLKELSAKIKFSEERVKFYVAQIALAFDHLHQNQVLYRDLEPGKIFLDEKGYVRLKNLELPNLLMNRLVHDELRANVGSGAYLAPEVIISESYSKASDWWTLGILTYELIVGEMPFWRKDLFCLRNVILECPVSFSPDLQISTQAKDFIKRCLEKKPENRLGSQGNFEEIKKHPWLSDIDWQAILDKKVEAPFKPNWEK